MLTYSQCADPKCAEPLMAVTWVGQQTHPNCEQTAEETKLREFVDAAQRGDEKAANALEAELSKPKPVAKLGSVALWYAKRGWPVFPLAPGSKLPGLPSAHPKGDPERGKCKGECGKLGHGLHDATTDEAQIRAWWKAVPTYGIGLATGHAFDVIDVDGPQGYQSLRELGDDILPAIHGKVSTVREGGGEHLYILATGDGNRAGFKPGLDYRGVGGYVCAPPTEVDGRRYSWIVQPSPEILGKAES